MQYYSFEDVHCAKQIQARPELFTPEFHTWADDVLDWWKYFWLIVKKTAKHFFGGDIRLALKDIWTSYIRQHTCAGQIYHTWLRLLSFLKKASQGVKRYITNKGYPDPEYRTPTVRPKTERSRKAIHCRAIADTYQCRVAYSLHV